jgi:hypothetical protein
MATTQEIRECTVLAKRTPSRSLLREGAEQGMITALRSFGLPGPNKSADRSAHVPAFRRSGQTAAGRLPRRYGRLD